MIARMPFVGIVLGMGVAVPILYFCIQIVAAFFYPGYSFFHRDASSLGSPDSQCPAVFNVGAIVVGVVTGIAAWGYWRAFRALRGHPVLMWFTVFAIASFGVSCVNAGLFPMPDPRHVESPLAAVGLGVIVLPILMPMAFWKLCRGRGTRVLFLLNTGLFLALIPVMSGLIQFTLVKLGVEWPDYQHFLNHDHGLLQRVFAFVATAPIGLGAYILGKRMRRSEPLGEPIIAPRSV